MALQKGPIKYLNYGERLKSSNRYGALDNKRLI